MGCDIHGWVEVNDGSKWIAIKELKSAERNYRRFAALAGVRNYNNEYSAEPRGLPSDVSETAKYDIEQLGTDGHSHSYMSIREASAIFLDTTYQPRNFAKEYPESEYFDVEIEDIDNFRLIFWFDN